MDGNEVVKYIESIYHFCLRRIANRVEAEDLASEIILHILDGVNHYQINFFEAWVWRIAHNRYARYVRMQKKKQEYTSDKDLDELEDDYCIIDDDAVTCEYQIIFKCLHTLTSEYKNIMVDYYIYELPVKSLAIKYRLSESTIKWRLNIGRKKIKERIEVNEMDKVYKRIKWETNTCNGSMNSDKYLHNQVSRAICEAAFETPLTVEEISLATGLPTMYVEDFLPNLIYGDAIEQYGNKYATNFIILRNKDKKIIADKKASVINSIADCFENLFITQTDEVSAMNFYGSDFSMPRLGYIAIPAALRGKVNNIKDSMPEYNSGPFPPRKDGGHGWFIVQEVEEDEGESVMPYDSGCNISEGDDYIYYYWIGKYFNSNIYHNGGTRWLDSKKIPSSAVNGIIPEGILTEDDIIRLLGMNLIYKYENKYKLRFPCFTHEEFISFRDLFKTDDTEITELIKQIIKGVKECFLSFVPKRLDSQINQYISSLVSCVGEVIEELINRGILEKPDIDVPLTNGVFYIEGEYLNV